MDGGTEQIIHIKHLLKLISRKSQEQQQVVLLELTQLMHQSLQTEKKKTCKIIQKRLGHNLLYPNGESKIPTPKPEE